jgi:RsiW-degrading membrane proteinase PrsW (M82 family)/RNA polymerase subunit RPABC4/transcription elongation factor Spt4
LVLGTLGSGGLSQLSQGQLSIGNIAYESFVVAGVTEELGKFLVVRLFIYKSPYFDDSTDGIIYASAVALGFATLENIGYTISYGWQVILIRGPISTFAHVLFSTMWGYPLALSKIGYPRAGRYVLLGLVGAMAAHGFFDFLLFTQTWYALLAIPLFAGLITALNLMLRHSRRVSEFINKVAELQIDCPNCGAKTPTYAEYCPNCGKQMDKALEKIGEACGRCGAALEKNSKFCTACGSRIVRKPLKT